MVLNSAFSCLSQGFVAQTLKMDPIEKARRWKRSLDGYISFRKAVILALFAFAFILYVGPLIFSWIFGARTTRYFGQLIRLKCVLTTALTQKRPPVWTSPLIHDCCHLQQYQCDYVGWFFKLPGNKLIYKSSTNIWGLFELFRSITFNKLLLWQIFGLFGKSRLLFIPTSGHP